MHFGVPKPCLNSRGMRSDIASRRRGGRSRLFERRIHIEVTLPSRPITALWPASRMSSRLRFGAADRHECAVTVLDQNAWRWLWMKPSERPRTWHGFGRPHPPPSRFGASLRDFGWANTSTDVCGTTLDGKKIQMSRSEHLRAIWGIVLQIPLHPKISHFWNLNY